jgi:hypothetical protein
MHSQHEFNITRFEKPSQKQFFHRIVKKVKGLRDIQISLEQMIYKQLTARK